jgi:hypothetical protein
LLIDFYKLFKNIRGGCNQVGVRAFRD